MKPYRLKGRLQTQANFAENFIKLAISPFGIRFPHMIKGNNNNVMGFDSIKYQECYTQYTK